MMFLSVLVLAITIQVSVSRRLTDDVDNEVSSNPMANIELRDPSEWVKISQPPVPVISKNYGERVELFCEAMGSPPPIIQWYKENMRLTENERYEVDVFPQNPALAKMSSRIVINYLLPRHQDIYRCVAESGSQVASAVTKLLVMNGREMNFTQLIQSKILGAHHVPRITFWSPTYMDTMGSDVVLPCKTVGNPKPKLTWYAPNGKAISPNSDRMKIFPEGELRIKSITWRDMGVYTCYVSNLVGEDQTETFLYPMQESSK